MYVQLLYNPMGLPDSDDTNPGACVTLDWQQMVGDGCGKQVQRCMEQDYGHLFTIVGVLVCLKKKQQLFFARKTSVAIRIATEVLPWAWRVW